MEAHKKIAAIILLACFLIASFSIYMMLDIVTSKNYRCVTESTTTPYLKPSKNNLKLYSEEYFNKKLAEPMYCWSIPQTLKYDDILAWFLGLITWIVSVVAAHILSYFTDLGINKIRNKFQV